MTRPMMTRLLPIARTDNHEGHEGHEGHDGTIYPIFRARQSLLLLPTRWSRRTREAFRVLVPFVKMAQIKSTPAKKYPISYAAVSGASEPCVALRSIDSANSLRSVPPSALAGSVAPISVRHFLMPSSASSTRTIAGPDDMNDVRLPKNGRSRCTA